MSFVKWFLTAAGVTVVSLHISSTALAQHENRDRPDPANYLLAEAEIPTGFRYHPKYDRRIDEPGLSRITRLYARGSPEAPTDDHASLLFMVAVSQTEHQAAVEFGEAAAGWSKNGYAVSSLGGLIGEESVAAEAAFFGDSDHPKSGLLIHFRVGTVNVTVQYTDDPGQPLWETALDIARRIESQSSATDETSRETSVLLLFTGWPQS